MGPYLTLVLSATLVATSPVSTIATSSEATTNYPSSPALIVGRDSSRAAIPTISPAANKRAATEYYLSRWRTEGIAIRKSAGRVKAAFPAVGDALFCFKGRQRERPTSDGGVMYVGKRMGYVMGRSTKWKP